MFFIGDKNNSSKKIECKESNKFTPIKFGRSDNTASNVIKILIGDKNNKAKELYFMPLYDLRYSLPVYNNEGDIYNNAIEIIAAYKNNLSKDDFSIRDPKNPEIYIDTLYFNSIRKDIPIIHILDLFNNNYINRYSKYINTIYFNHYEDLNVEYHGLCGTNNNQYIDITKIINVPKYNIENDNNHPISYITKDTGEKINVYTQFNVMAIATAASSTIRIVLSNGNCMRIKSYIENTDNYDVDKSNSDEEIPYEKLSDNSYVINNTISEDSIIYFKLKNFDGYIEKSIYDKLKTYTYIDDISFITDFFGITNTHNNSFKYITDEKNFYDEILGNYHYSSLHHIILDKNISKLNGCFRLTPKLKSIFIANQNLTISDTYNSFDVTEDGCIILWKKESLDSNIAYNYKTLVKTYSPVLIIYPCVENSAYLDGFITINNYSDSTYDKKIESLEYINLYNTNDELNNIIG